MPNFGRDLLKSLGAPVTAENLRFIDAWTKAEGTKARFNPLATTRNAPGATAFNSVGVRNFPSYRVGVEKTRDTLLNGYYDPIVSLMRSGKATARDMASAVAESPWGTGSGVLRVLGVAAPASTKGRTAASLPKSTPEVPSSTPAAPSFSRLPDIAGTVLANLGQKSPEESLAALVGEVQNPSLLKPIPAAPTSPVPTTVSAADVPAGQRVPKITGKGIALPGSFKSTHATSNLGWPAIDIPGKPGTPVRSPLAGEIVRHGSAQGGEALYLDTNGDGQGDYWLGHVTQMLPVGTRVRRGQQIAVISPDHAVPHAHWARRGR
jgi:hypothetical protein